MSSSDVVQRYDARHVPEVVCIRPPVNGFFVNLNYVCICLWKLEHSLFSFRGTEVWWDRRSIYFSEAKGPNAWLYYFEPLLGQPAPDVLADAPRIDIRRWDTVVRGSLLSHRLIEDRQEMARLARQYIRVRPDVQRQVDGYVQSLFRGRHVVGIHYRGTDKRLESRRLSYEEVADATETKRRDLVFVATDEADFLAYARQRWGDARVRWIQGVNRSESKDTTNQYAQDDPYRSGYYALIDCLMLSRCLALVKTNSNLSRWSMFFNPALDTTELR